MTKLKVLSLFAGIGGFDLGLERTGGFETVAFCEIDPFCQKVLRKHWPKVPCYDDVRTLTAERLASDGIAVDVICGGFPCQDISTAGSGAGLAGERSGLWWEYSRLIRELRPKHVLVENVSALLGRGLADVLAELATLRYNAEWHCIPASAVGAPHQRDRIWIVANSRSGRRGAAIEGKVEQPRRAKTISGSEAVAYSNCERELQSKRSIRYVRGRAGHGSAAMAYTICFRQPRSRKHGDASNPSPRITRQAIDAIYGCVGNEWSAEPNVGRVANGVPNRMDRLRALGNAVVPQIPEIIGRIILMSGHG